MVDAARQAAVSVGAWLRVIFQLLATRLPASPVT